MDFIEVLERARQLCQHGQFIAQIHTADVIAFEGVDEALGHAVALWTAHGRIDGLQAQRSCNAARLVRDVGTAVVREELQFELHGHGIDRTEAPLHRFDQHVTHRLARQAFAAPGSPCQDLPVAAVLGEGGRHGLA